MEKKLMVLLSSLFVVLASAGPAAAATQDQAGPAPAGPVVQAAQTAVGQEPSTPTGVVNVNTATNAQLQLLPGVGPSRAQAILEHRDREPFRRVEDLLRIRGIGRATLARLLPYVVVEGETTLTRPVPGGRRPPQRRAP
jgi:competence protein ComEA